MHAGLFSLIKIRGIVFHTFKSGERYDVMEIRRNVRKREQIVEKKKLTGYLCFSDRIFSLFYDIIEKVFLLFLPLKIKTE